ncbi:hypothetical protein TNCV_5117371 [Trichonephila clavipes]|nr:hypothetical protein TNCV_5117371 [Trichonephila clavipes]
MIPDHQPLAKYGTNSDNSNELNITPNVADSTQNRERDSIQRGPVPQERSKPSWSTLEEDAERSGDLLFSGIDRPRWGGGERGGAVS